MQMNKNVFGILIAGASAFYGMPLASAQSQNPWVMGRVLTHDSYIQSGGCNQGVVLDLRLACAYLGWRMTSNGIFETRTVTGRVANIRIGASNRAEAGTFETRAMTALGSEIDSICPAAPTDEAIDLQDLARSAPQLTDLNRQHLAGILIANFMDSNESIQLNSINIASVSANVLDDTTWTPRSGGVVTGWTPARCLSDARTISFDSDRTGALNLGGSGHTWRACVEGIRRATTAALNHNATQIPAHLALGRAVAGSPNWSRLVESARELLPSNRGLSYARTGVVVATTVAYAGGK